MSHPHAVPKRTRPLVGWLARALVAVGAVASSSAVLLSPTAAHAAAPACAPQTVCVYENIDFAGQLIISATGSMANYHTFGAGDRASSVVNAVSTSAVVLYDDINYAGWSVCVPPSTAVASLHLPLGFGDRASSHQLVAPSTCPDAVRVYLPVTWPKPASCGASYACAWEHINYTGRSWAATGTTAIPTTLRSLISSVANSGNTHDVIFKAANGDRLCVPKGQGIPDPTGFGWNDRIVSHQWMAPGTCGSRPSILFAGVNTSAPATVVQTSANGTDRINVNQYLGVNQSIRSGNGVVRLVLQTDGNLVEYDSSNAALWASGTQGRVVTHVAHQADRGLVIYNGTTVVWAADRSGASTTVLQGDAHLVSYTSGGSVVWATGVYWPKSFSRADADSIRWTLAKIAGPSIVKCGIDTVVSQAHLELGAQDLAIADDVALVQNLLSANPAKYTPWILAIQAGYTIADFVTGDQSCHFAATLIKGIIAISNDLDSGSPLVDVAIDSYPVSTSWAFWGCGIRIRWDRLPGRPSPKSLSVEAEYPTTIKIPGVDRPTCPANIWAT